VLCSTFDETTTYIPYIRVHICKCKFRCEGSTYILSNEGVNRSGVISLNQTLVVSGGIIEKLPGRKDANLTEAGVKTKKTLTRM
jgi:hypothetical protein